MAGTIKNCNRINARRRSIYVIASLLGITTALTSVQSVQAQDGIPIPRLEAGKTTVPLNQRTLLWECWANAKKTRPVLYQRIDGTWQRLTVARVSRDRRTCRKKYPFKTEFTVTITDPGKWNPKKGYYEARMLTTRPDCARYKWKLPIMKPAPQPPNQPVYYANCDEALQAGAAPLLIGLPGYREELDSDGDGVACEIL